MPVYSLPDYPKFPPPFLGDESGLLAIGGALTPDWLLEAYSHGIFPWFNEGEPILWWSPDPRLVLFPEKLVVSKSMQKILASKIFQITFDTSFEKVIDSCANTKRKESDGTWITDEMKKAYCDFHELGFAHSVEVWSNEKLVGGLYGVSLGSAFFGESMFSFESNASKAGFITLVHHLIQKGFTLIDCQVRTEHLVSLGAEEIPRKKFLKLLETALGNETRQGKWKDWLEV